MADASTIQTLRSPDLVTTSILVDGEELSAEYQVLNIVVDKEVNRIPAARIVLLDGDPSKRTFEISERDLFIPGKEIEIKAGYHSDNETIFKGVVVKMSIKIRSGDSYLHVLCKDAAEKLTNGRKSRYFYDQADSDIIGMIADGHGLEKDIDNTTVQHDEMVQYNVTDWDFCVVRAQANGKVVIVDDGKISVKTPDTSQEEVETVTYGSTILDLDAEMDARDQAGSFKTTAWNVADQELKETEADEPDVEMNGNVPFDKLSNAAGHDALELKNGAAINDAELQQWANAKALFSRMAKVRGRVKFRGAAVVKPGKMLKLDGVGDRFNGKVFVSGVRHQIVNGGWTTDAQFGIDPKWFSEKNKINDLPAAGLLAAVHGLQVGIVTQIERDPEG
jgi:Rhs element Vgr protein